MSNIGARYYCAGAKTKANVVVETATTDVWTAEVFQRVGTLIPTFLENSYQD